MLDITIWNPLSPARIRDGLENPLTLQKNAWDEKITRFRRVFHASATAAKLFPMSISTLGGRHPDAHRAIGPLANKIASRTLSSLHCTMPRFSWPTTLAASCLVLPSRSSYLDLKSYTAQLRFVISLPSRSILPAFLLSFRR